MSVALLIILHHPPPRFSRQVLYNENNIAIDLKDKGKGLSQPIMPNFYIMIYGTRRETCNGSYVDLNRAVRNISMTWPGKCWDTFIITQSFYGLGGKNKPKEN